LIWASFLPAIAGAHSMSAALLRLDARADGTMEVLLKIPRVESGPSSLRVRLPDRCRRIGDRTSRQTPNAIIESWRIACTPNDLRAGQIAVDGLNPAVGELFVHLQNGEQAPWTGVLTRDASTLTVANRSVGKGAPQQAMHGFFVLGVEHIWSGPDHLLFVLALLLLVMRANRNEPPRVIASTMAWTVTAFTVAHSLTLAGSVLGLVRLPSTPVEVAIALSVLLLAVELTREGPERTLTARYPWAVAFAFGLLHGFGFAGVLRDIGLPEDAIGRTLFLFNLGVEAGQLVFLLALGTVWWLVRRFEPVIRGRRDALRESFERVAAYGIGVAAVFWCLQRVWST
jgi:hydrogenase/urease accessory protein HupE